MTGLGVASAAGCDPAAFWRTLVEGRSAVRPIRRFDASHYPSRIAAELDEESLPETSARWRDRGRIARFAAAAAAQAIAGAGLSADEAARCRAGVVIAAGLGTYDHEETFGPCLAAAHPGGGLDWDAFNARLRPTRKPAGAERRSPGSIAATLAEEHRLRGPVMAVMTACAGGTQAIGDALRWIRAGKADVVVAGGADSEIYPMGLATFCLLGALSRRNDAPEAASRPFDRGRDGFVLGEGAGVLVLEERDHALARGAPILAEVAGFGGASDAYRVTDPHPEGRGATLAMARALADGGLPPGAVGYVNAHGTSTVANDEIETRAMKCVFGDHARRLAVNATKSMIGHATTAAGALEAVVTVLTLVHQVAHPTINQEDPDPACDLDYTPNRARSLSVEIGMTNSFAFGGQCASLVFRRHEE